MCESLERILQRKIYYNFEIKSDKALRFCGEALKLVLLLQHG